MLYVQNTEVVTEKIEGSTESFLIGRTTDRWGIEEAVAFTSLDATTSKTNLTTWYPQCRHDMENKWDVDTNE
jgi:hypothetical protein